MHPIYDPDRIPPLTRQTLDDYAKHGMQPGDCLRAVLAGDLFAAFARADDLTAAAMPAIVVYVRRLPAAAWGSYQVVQAWIDARAAERLKFLDTRPAGSSR